MTEPDAPLATDPAPAAPEPPAPAVPESPAERERPSPPRQPRRTNDALPWLVALGFLVLASAIGLVGWWNAWHEQQAGSELRALANRVAQFEQRREPARSFDLDPLQARVAMLANQVSQLEQQRPAQPADLGPLEARVAALEQRPTPDLASLEAQVAALQKQATDASQISARVDALAAQVAALAGRDRSAEGDLAHRLDTDEARLTALEQATAAMTAKADRAARQVRIEAARMALAAGQKLGTVPGAPSAVARFAAASPPTEAALRLAFPRAEQAALAASQPDTDGKPFLGQMLTRAEELVTVRQGDRVLVGNPAAGVLARARGALDAGDLAGAVAAVSDLSGPPAAAMAAWLADAQALLAARAGLADLAAHG